MAINSKTIMFGEYVKSQAASYHALPDLDDFSADEDCIQATIEVDVIPRLLAASRSIETEPADARAEPADLDRFCTILLSDTVGHVNAYIDRLIDRGISLDALYLGHLAGAARRLGVLWEEDAISLGEVSMGLMRMHQILRRLSPSFISDAPLDNDGRVALFAVAPGETHALGVVIMADFFTRAGWRTQVDINPKIEGLVTAVNETNASVVGISASATRFLPEVTSTIKAIRKATQDRRVLVLVGGNAFVEEPDAANRVGADQFASDALEALEAAGALKS
ncbi:MAG: cobalamin-dependent protein [Pseudomonadota bacterium]